MSPGNERVIGRGTPTDPQRYHMPGVNADVPLDNRGFNCYTRKQYRVVTFDLAVARTDVEVNIAGTFFWVINATNDTATASIRLDQQTNDYFPVNRGHSISGLPFAKFWITNAAQAGLTLYIFVAEDCPGDRIDIQP